VITLITGAPGAGKTAALVDLLSGFKDRPIYVDGIPELVLGHEVLSDAKQWPAVVPDGAAVVIDEVQRVWRPAGAGSRVPPDIEALETHRHRGLDFFIVTQHPNLVHQNVRRLVGRHVHLRDVGILGRWWYEWPEATNPETFRNAPVKKRYSLPKSAFGKYKSASLHVKPIRSVPRSVIVLGLALCAVAFLGWKAYQSIGAKLNPAPVAAPAPAASAPTREASAEVGLAGRPGAASGPRWPLYDSGPVVKREPYHARAFTLDGGYSLGRQLVAFFGLHVDGRRVGTVTLSQLVAAGYSYTELGPCAGLLRFGDVERAVTCAPPHQEKPAAPVQSTAPAAPLDAP
jgi:zona occludens toxin (predicted ATPase)